MNNYLLLIYPAILIAITFFKAKLYKKQEFSPSFWNQTQGKYIQAVACLGIILHHLTQRYTSFTSPTLKNPITIFNSMGILFTSIFFFFSGYGLIRSVLLKPDYMKTFFWHRLPLVLVPFYVTNTLFVLLEMYMQTYPPASYISVLEFTGFFLVSGNFWFIIEILYFYILFFFFFTMIKKKDIALALLCLSSVVIIYISYNSGHHNSYNAYHWFKGEWWYNSTLTFVMGLLFARFHEGIVRFIKKHYLFLLIPSAIIFFAVFVIEEIILKNYGYYEIKMFTGNISGQLITFLAQTLLCILFMWLVLLLNMKIEIGNFVLSKIGIISLELYLIHDLYVETIFYNQKLNIFLRYGLIIILSIVTAVIIHFINQYIIKFINKKIAGKKYHFTNENDLLQKKEKENLKRRKQIIVITLTIILFTFVLFGLYFRIIKPRLECNSEIKALKNSNVGDIILLGRYDTAYDKFGKEKLEWIVLKKEVNKYMLITKNGLTGGAYNELRQESNWSSSDLHNKLNNEMFNTIFSTYEAKYLYPNPDDNSLVSLLSVSEAKTLFSDNHSRELILTDNAIKEGIANYNTLSKVNYWDVKGYRTSWWWLRGTEDYSIKAPYVSIDGEIIENEKDVFYYSGAIRPVVWISVDN